MGQLYALNLLKSFPARCYHHHHHSHHHHHQQLLNAVEDEGSDSEEESDIEGLTNDDGDEEENDIHFYHLFDPHHKNTEEEGEPSPLIESNVEMTPEEQTRTEKWLKKFERALKRLNK